MGRVQLRPKPQTLKDDLSIKEKKGGKQNEYPMRQISILIKVNYARGEPPLKCLSNSEFRARLDKGLCFRYNDKYSYEHKCKVKENREVMLLIANGEEDRDEGEVKVEAKPEVVEYIISSIKG